MRVAKEHIYPVTIGMVTGPEQLECKRAATSWSLQSAAEGLGVGGSDRDTHAAGPKALLSDRRLK